MILGCHFRLGAGRAAPERFLREKTQKSGPDQLFASKTGKSAQKRTFRDDGPQNDQKKHCLQKHSGPVADFCVSGRKNRMLAPKIALWGAKRTFGTRIPKMR